VSSSVTQTAGISLPGIRFDAMRHGPWRVRTSRFWGSKRTWNLVSNGRGRWTDGLGRLLPALDGAIDIDLSASPFTNTLPIRRLLLARGSSADIRAVYVHFPDLAILADPQRYTCLEPLRRYRYESLDSDFVLDKVAPESYFDGSFGWYVGPPLPEIFRRLLPEASTELIESAVLLYLERFGNHGARDSIVYPGIGEMLASLCSSRRLFVVTSENTPIAEQILTAHSLGVISRPSSGLNETIVLKTKRMPCVSSWKPQSSSLTRPRSLVIANTT
jgi:hypothetical protein